MKKITLLSLSIFAISLAGCGSPTANVGHEQNRQAEAAGSPFRWKIQSAGGGTSMSRVMIDLPVGTTKADDTLKRDILSQIESVELSQQRNTNELEEVRMLPDGREVWIIKNQQHGIGYIVTMQPSPQGGTDFALDGPYLFSKNGG